MADELSIRQIRSIRRFYSSIGMNWFCTLHEHESTDIAVFNIRCWNIFVLRMRNFISAEFPYNRQLLKLLFQMGWPTGCVQTAQFCLGICTYIISWCSTFRFSLPLFSFIRFNSFSFECEWIAFRNSNIDQHYLLNSSAYYKLEFRRRANKTNHQHYHQHQRTAMARRIVFNEWHLHSLLHLHYGYENIDL